MVLALPGSPVISSATLKVMRLSAHPNVPGRRKPSIDQMMVN